MIQFANPAALWLLTLILPLILLYLLKRTRRDVVVPSLLLWRQALEDMRAQTPFQKLRSNLLLFLQILIIVLLTALLSEPYLPKAPHQRERWILVMDASASMKAVDEKPERFTSARNELFKVLSSVPRFDEVMLISFSQEASMMQSFSKNHAMTRSLLMSLNPDDVSGNWDQVRLILDPLLKENPKPKIVIASDFAGFPESMRKLPFQALRVGRSGNNVGITRAVLEPLPENPQKQALFYQFQNFAPVKQVIDVELRIDDEVVDAFAMELAPLQSLERSAELLITKPSVIKIVLKPVDDFAIDNDFLLYAEPRTKIGVRTEYQNPFLLKALKVLPSVQLSPSGEITISIVNSSTISDDKPAIVFLTAQENTRAGRLVQWNDSHPAMRFVDAGLWRFSHYSTLDLPAGTEVLMEATEGAVGYASDQQGKRKIILGFNLEQTNLVFLAGFPVFLQNSIEWIAKGLRRPLPSLTGGRFKKEGLFREGSRQGYANFADVQESDIAPKKVTGTAVSYSQTISSRLDLSSWFLILLVVVIILEWWVYHRRIHQI